jgi:CRP-like cAMP-binding protein
VSPFSKDSSSIPIGNRLLARLPRDEYERLLPNLEVVRFPRNRILYEAGDEVRCAYFLNDGLVSLLAITEAGQTVATFVALPEPSSDQDQWSSCWIV